MSAPTFTALGQCFMKWSQARHPSDSENENLFVIMKRQSRGRPGCPAGINPDISPQVEEIILHAMERDSNNRYHSASAMKADLDNTGAVELTGRCDRLQNL